MDWTRVEIDKMLDLSDVALIALMNDVLVAIKPTIGEPTEMAGKAIAKYNAKMVAQEELTGPEKFVITRWCAKAKERDTEIRMRLLEQEGSNDSSKP